MQIITYSNIEEEFCRLAKKWGVRFHFEHDGFSPIEATHTAPWFNEAFLGENFLSIKFDRCGLLLFDTELEAREIYENTLLDESDDGETGVYACLIDPFGNTITENT